MAAPLRRPSSTHRTAIAYSDVLAGARVTLDRLAISNGSTDSYQGSNLAKAGGGVANYGNLTITRSIVTDNATPSLGGGVYNTGMVTIRDSWITENRSDSGGGLFSSGSAYLMRTHVEGNRAEGIDSGPPVNPGPGGGAGPSAGGAGGVTSSGYLSIVRSVIADNVGNNEWGHGGVATVGGEIRDSLIARNQGVICGTGGISMVEAHLIGSTVTANTNGNCGPGAGGVYAVDSEIVNSTISGNRATSDWVAAGIRAERSSIVSSTITANISSFGFGGLDSDHAVVRNTILSGNGPVDCRGTLVSGGHNLFGSISQCAVNANGADLIGLDPRLGPLTDNGGFTLTHALRPNSPAIDAWYDGTVGPGATCPMYDQRGVTRPQDGNGDGTKRCDIGAMERTRP